MPPGGDGYYYFSTFLLGGYNEIGFFDIEINGDLLCEVRVEQQETFSDYPQSGCNAATYATQGESLVFSISRKITKRSKSICSFYYQQVTRCRLFTDLALTQPL